MDTDSFGLNIQGVKDLVQSDTNKTETNFSKEEGQSSDYVDVLELPMDDEELLKLREEWENKSNPYTAKISPRQKKNKLYYAGKQRSRGDSDNVVSSNLIFESQETFIPQALSKNPEPVVWSDNTNEGKAASNEIKTMLQYHADVLCLRKKLGVMVRHWSVYFTGILKHGWDEDTKEITTEIRKPQNFLLDPDGYIDEFGNYKGDYLGEKVTCTAEHLIELYPKHKEYITLKADGKMGTRMTYTEWWTDKYCFYSFADIILDKHKNQYFNYEEGGKTDEYGQAIMSATPTMNHFTVPKMPYTFLSVFSLQDQPHDITNLIEQNVPNQDRINDRDDQISRNLRAGNNSIALSGLSFNVETAKQAASALEDGDPVLVPDGQVDAAIKRLPASNIPPAVFTAQENDKLSLRSIFGVQGLSAQPNKGEDTTARGMILNQSHDSTRIGGGIGDALEQVADNVFNWWLQMYYVFYDEPHYAAIMGNGRAVEFVALVKSNMNRHFVVSVSANSMQPKDEITEQNLAIDLANKGWLDPINLFKKLNYPDPMETAKMVTLFRTNPQMYMMTYFPEQGPVMPQGGQPNPGDIGLEQPAQQQPNISAEPASAALSNVPINTEATPK